MNTKRINNEFHRLDVKLPLAVYEQISEIAVNSFDAKIHHISKKPEITSTLIYLLQLGIESFSGGNELTKKPDTDKHTDTIPIADEQVKELIKNELYPMQCKLDELSELVYRLTNTDNNTDKNIYVNNLENTIDVSTTDINTDSLTDSLTDNITEDNTPLELPILPVNEDLGIITPEVVVSEETGVKSHDEAKKEIERLKRQGLSNTDIAKELTGKYLTAKGMIDWKDIQVKRILQKIPNNCTDTQKK